MKAELARRLVDGLLDCAVNFMSYLPETRLGEIVPLLEDCEGLRLVRTAHEGTAVSIACGAAFAGMRPAVYMEGTGLYVATWSLQTIACRSQLPIVLLTSYVGSLEDRRNNYTFAGFGPRIQPLLDTLGIPHHVISDGNNMEDRIADVVRTASATKAPAALLFTGEFTE